MQFYFKISNSWQLSATDKANLVKQINGHKDGLSVLNESAQSAGRNVIIDDSDDSDDSSWPESDKDEEAEMKAKNADKANEDKEVIINANNGCCTIL